MKTPKEIIINNEVVLKIINKSDTQRLTNLANHKIFCKNMGDTFPYPYTINDADRFINHSHEGHTKEKGEKNYGIYIDEEYAGNLGREVKESGRKKHNYHIGYRLGEPYWGKGYMTTIVQGLTEYMFEHIADCHRIYALAFGWNRGSARVLEKCGFTLEATLKEAVYREGAWYDEWIYGKLRGE